MTIRSTNPTTTDASARFALVTKVREAVSDMSYANRRLFEIRTGPIDKR